MDAITSLLSSTVLDTLKSSPLILILYLAFALYTEKRKNEKLQDKFLDCIEQKTEYKHQLKLMQGDTHKLHSMRSKADKELRE